MKNSAFSNFKVFAGNSHLELAEEIASIMGKPLGRATVTKFSDGEISVNLWETVRGMDCYIVQSTCDPVNDNLMEILIMIDAMKRASAGRINAVIPYYGYARQDRKAKARDPITAKLVADMLVAAGADRVLTMDLHAAQIQGFFNFPTDDLTCIPMMAQYFRTSDLDMKDVVVVSPDHGGTTRARKLAELLGVPMAIIDKRRPRPNVCEANNVIGDVSGKNVIVVDDICDTGGSLVAGCELLKEKGAKDIYTCVTHAVFSGKAAENIQNSPIKKMVVTNTIPLSEEFKSKCNKVTVLSVGWMLSKIIHAISAHQPVSEIYALFDNK